MFTNESGKSFYHPVTNQLVKPGQTYSVPAHRDYEKVVDEKSVSEEDEVAKAEAEAKSKAADEAKAAADEAKKKADEEAAAKKVGEK